VNPTWRRLLQIGSAPGWIGIIVFIYRIVGHAANIDSIFPAIWNSRLIALWNFLQTPDGNVVLAIAGTGWLIALVFWPSHSREATARAQPPVADAPGIPTNPILPAAAPLVREPIPAPLAADTTQPCKKSWTVVKGSFMQLIPDPAGCTAVLKSGEEIINARFDKTWLWHLSHLESGTTLSVEGMKSLEQTDQPVHLLDCVCPDGIRVRPRSN